MDSGKQGTGLENQGLGVQIRLKNWALHRHREGSGGWPEQPAGGGVRKMREGVNNQGRLKARGGQGRGCWSHGRGSEK